MQRGVSSELFDSLKVYLNNKNRLQPIIGLSSIIECVKTGSDGREALYLCEVCVCRLSMADMRNHIMGSLHRYNYIKARHPHFASEWKENADLSLLAWPLMETAKVLEGKEGPGDIKLLEVGDAVFQKMARHSDSDAVTLINSLRHGQGQSDPERTQLERYTVQSQRIVLLGQDLRRQSKRSHKTSAQTNKPPSLIQSTVASSVNSNSWLNNISTSQLDKTQMSANSNSFLDGYTGTKPLIGLFSVVECRSEDGRTYCFLCHCCRIRVNKKDIIDHLTSTSHLVNSLMESHPEQVEDINDNQHLQSLAKKVEQEEGRGELEVVNAPESLCILLTGKSYHWCIKMLCNGWTHNNFQKKKIAVKGPIVNKTFNQGMAEKRALVQSKERMTSKRKMRKAQVSRKLTFLYLANDVIQNSKRKGPEFTQDFAPVIVDAFKHVYREGEEGCKKQLGRVLSIWQERTVYENNLLDQLSQVLYGEKKAKKRSYEETQPDDEDFASQSSPAEPPQTAELIRALQELENAASGDSVLRQRISSLPAEVQDTSLLHRITDKESGERLSRLVEEACMLLADYSGRLAAEIDDRRQLTRTLTVFLQSQKDGLAQNEQKLEEYKRKLARVTQVRKELRSRLNNLPGGRYNSSN